MTSNKPTKYPALLCILALIVAILLIRPFVEMGFADDWAYIRTANYLANTGHLDYFGWAQPMLGWQLFIGVLFIKLFGFSFTVVRASIFCVSIALTWLLYITSIRCGLRPLNAAFAVLTLVLSPIFLPIAYSYMSDVAAYFAIVLCLYCCLRALQAANDRRAIYWLVLGAGSNLVTGTARQIGWLGVIVLIPTTFLIMRNRRLPVATATVLWLACIGLIYSALVWFKHQLFSESANVIAGPINIGAFHQLIVSVLHFLLGVSFVLLPISVAFVGPIAAQRLRRSALLLLAAGGLCLLLVLGLRHNHEALLTWLAPFNQDFVTRRGLLEMPDLGNRPIVFNESAQLILTLITLIATLSFLLFMRQVSAPDSRSLDGATPISKTQLFKLLWPFAAAYFCLLLPHAAFEMMRDKYAWPLMLVAVILSARIYQDHVRPNIPAVSFICLGIFTAFSIAGTHDVFVMHRARLYAANKLIGAGISRTEFYGGFEYDGTTQIEQWGYVNDNPELINVPKGVPYRLGEMSVKPCGYQSAKLFIAIRPRYALSYSPDSCDGPTKFSPVVYRTWLPPFAGTIYIVAVAQP